MKRGVHFTALLSIVISWCMWIGAPLEVYAEIASDDAFEGVTWEKIFEDDIEGPNGVVQSMCATENYIICIENYEDSTEKSDIIKAYYRNDTDVHGKPVERYSLAKRVVERSYEHGNGMAYNPNTHEIAVALYTHLEPENRGCIFLMDSETLSFKRKVKIADDYNILGIGYDGENDRYIIQTNVDGGYSFKILDNQFKIIEDLGEYDGTAKGNNFQDLCVSGDYIINFPLTLGLGIGDYINMYSISRKELVSDPKLDFQLGDVSSDEPESICELEPGVFIAAVNVVEADGSRKIRIYKTMVPYNFPAVPVDEKEEPDAEPAVDDKAQEAKQKKVKPEENEQEKVEPKEAGPEEAGQPAEPVMTEADNADAPEEKEEKPPLTDRIRQMMNSHSMKSIMKTALFIFFGVDIVLFVYLKVLAIRRKRKRKLERARRERQRIRQQIRAMYGEQP